MTRSERRNQVQPLALAVKRVAIQAGWEVKHEHTARTRSVYIRLRHPERGRLKIRVADHSPTRPTRKTLHVLAGLPGSLPIAKQWLAAG